MQEILQSVRSIATGSVPAARHTAGSAPTSATNKIASDGSASIPASAGFTW
ncbi:MAG TPA: hypothetical protein VME43_17000 [Bryobacteraceae bacterium]|nr:hypothetical protein [Bryobacteraceae bacterium]